MKNTAHQLGNGWNWKSETHEKAGIDKKKKSPDDMLNLLAKLLFRAIIFVIVLTAVAAFFSEIVDLF